MASGIDATPDLFGWQFRRKPNKSETELINPQVTDDGAVMVAAGGVFGSYIDLSGVSPRAEADLISRYREMEVHPIVYNAVSEISNEAISTDEEGDVVNIDLDNLEDELNESLRKRISEEFDRVLDVLDFRNKSYDIFHRWYVDGRLNYHVAIDPKNKSKGISALAQVDPRKVKKVREVEKKRVKGSSAVSGAEITRVKKEYFVYNDNGFVSRSTQGAQASPSGTIGIETAGIKISSDAMVYVTSGLTDPSGNMVVSYLHKAIRYLNEMRMLEDASVIYRLSRAPERRVWYIDTTGMPRVKAEQHVKDVMTRNKNQVVFDPSTGQVRDGRKFMCYSLDTKIPLLDGRTLTLEEIMREYENGKKNWVYSCDPTSGKFAPGPISWAGITKKNSNVVKVTFDNGKSVVCTPDHKFPVWGKGFVEAKDLVGESIIPGYRRNKKINGVTNEYEQIFKNDTKTWEYTHREVARWKNEVGIREEMIHLEAYADKEKRTIHHRDYNRFNNSPENLAMMNRDDHLKYHRDMAKFGMNRKPNSSEDFTPEWKSKISAALKGRVAWSKTWKIKTPSGEQLIVENLNKFCRENGLDRNNIKRNYGSKKYFAEQLRNHKAVSVEPLLETMDVGCITVDLEETYHSHHTYLLDAGVYTKNTMTEDFWIPRSNGSKGTEVTQLQGGQNLGEMEDVEYFKRQVYDSLHVPVDRLQSSNVFTSSQSNVISRDEVRFSKFIGRLRNKFSQLFVELLGRQLALVGVMAPEDWDEIKNRVVFKYSKDNQFLEIKNQEVISGRMETLAALMNAAVIGKYVSHETVRKTVLMQTDEEIERENERIAKELQDPILNPPVDENGVPVSPDQIEASSSQKDDDGEPEDGEKIARAQQTYEHLQPKKNKTKQEQSEFKSAAQILAKN